MTHDDLDGLIAELGEGLDMLSTEIASLIDQEHEYEQSLRDVRQRLRERRAQWQSKQSRWKRTRNLKEEYDSRDTDDIVEAIRKNRAAKEARRG